MAEDIAINDANEFSVCRDSGMFVIFKYKILVNPIKPVLK